MSDYRYHAFISYSHRDAKWAAWVHRALETFRPPRGLAGADGAPLPRRIYPVFRDRDELPTSASLHERIREALAASRYLVVVCSPDAAESHWVNEEVRQFKASGGAGRVLAVIVGGGGPNGAGGAAREYFPLAVRRHVDESGLVTAEAVSPIAADVRPNGDGKRLALLKIVAGMLEVPLETLRRRDLRRQRQRMMAITGGALTLSAAFAWIAWRAVVARDDATRALAQSEFRAAVQSNSRNAPSETLAWAAAAMRRNPDGTAARAMALQLVSETTPRVLVLEALSAAFSPDGQRIVTASGDGTAQVWDAHTGARIGPALRHSERARSVAFSPDGASVVTASEDSTAQAWDATTGAKLGPALRHSGAVEGAAFSPDGQRVITASDDGTAQVWNPRTGAKLSPVLRQANLWSAVFSPDGQRIVTASGDGMAQVWDARNGTKLGPVLRHAGQVRSAVFSPDGQRVATASDDETAQLWDAQTGARLGPALQHSSSVMSVAFSADGQRVVTASADSTARVWPSWTSRPEDARDVAELAEAVAGMRVDEITFAIVPLPPAETNRRMRGFRERAERTRGTTPDPRSLDAFLQWWFGVAGAAR